MTCTKPPPGWSCSRGLHDGPCAARPDEGYLKVTVLRNSRAEKFCGELVSLHTPESIDDHGSHRVKHRYRNLDGEFFPAGVVPESHGTFTITVEFTPDEETKP